MEPAPATQTDTHQGAGLRLLSLGNVFIPVMWHFLTSSTDGGGIRGLSELIILQEIMKRIQHEEGRLTTPLPCEYFDLICGTSTGG
jgi:hypothetical protein